MIVAAAGTTGSTRKQRSSRDTEIEGNTQRMQAEPWMPRAA